jgi:hypothetical protein
MTPALAIVIVGYNARDDLARCLASIDARPPAVPFEVLLVDNGSTDGGPDLVERRWPRVRVLRQARNLGFGAANNVGIRATDAELVLLLNSDTIVPPGAIDRLVGRLGGAPDVAVAGPRLVSADGEPELSFGRMIGPWNELRQKALRALVARRVPPFPAWLRRRAATEHHPDWVSGACLLVRRADALVAGLFDERFFLYTEDVDFCAAIRRLGRRVLFTPVAEVVHLGGRSRASAPAATERAYRASQLAFYAKHHPGWLPWLRAYLRLRGKLPG